VHYEIRHTDSPGPEETNEFEKIQVDVCFKINPRHVHKLTREHQETAGTSNISRSRR
jgi:hypothetical protein